MRKTISLQRLIIGTVPLILIVLIWQYAVKSGAVSKNLLAAPTDIWNRLLVLLAKGYVEDIAVTLLRLLSGLGIATVLGITLGLAAALSRIGSRFVLSTVRLLAPVPKIAIYPALMLILGFGDTSKITLVAIEAVFPILLASYQGARMVEPKLIWWAMSSGASRPRIAWQIVLPAAVPSVLVGLRVAFIVSCVVVFLSEMISSKDGLGHVLILATRNYRTVDMFVTLLTISAIGLIGNLLIDWLRHRLQPGGR